VPRLTAPALPGRDSPRRQRCGLGALLLPDGRGRSNYAQAAEHLARIKHIRETGHDHTDWDDLIAMIREDNNNLPALQDELDKAGL
jgi:uncharacterized Zn finger protein